jgi:hypothetical protein
MIIWQVRTTEEQHTIIPTHITQDSSISFVYSYFNFFLSITHGDRVPAGLVAVLMP